MARQKGLEPLAYCLEGSCSIQLSYWRKCADAYCHTIPLPAKMERVMGIKPARLLSADIYYHIYFLLSIQKMPIACQNHCACQQKIQHPSTPIDGTICLANKALDQGFRHGKGPQPLFIICCFRVVLQQPPFRLELPFQFLEAWRKFQDPASYMFSPGSCTTPSMHAGG